jgi:hypothetical protein
MSGTTSVTDSREPSQPLLFRLSPRSSLSHKNRHPERSAAQACRVANRFMARSRRTPGMLVLPMPFAPFRPPKRAPAVPTTSRRILQGESERRGICCSADLPWKHGILSRTEQSQPAPSLAPSAYDPSTIVARRDCHLARDTRSSLGITCFTATCRAGKPQAVRLRQR